MCEEARFDEYLEMLYAAVGHKDRRAPLAAYIKGLIIPGRRKSVEPMAARVDPEHVRARHQSMHHFVANAPWSDEEMLRVARTFAKPQMESHGSIAAWIIDDTGNRKKGKHSVGVANQYCGVLGKNDNCQVAVTVSWCNEEASLPVGHRLYLPSSWTSDPERCRRCGVPDGTEFATKPEIAISLMDQLLSEPDAPRSAPVVADAGYGNSSVFRHELTARGLQYVVGVQGSTSVWPPGQAPLPPLEYSGHGRPATKLRYDDEHQPVQMVELARSLGDEHWHEVTWSAGTKGPMTGRFAALRVRPAHRDRSRTEPHPVEWLIIGWPARKDEPTHYWLSTLPSTTSLETLVKLAKLRWRVERDYQELKQEFGFGHYEGRGWRGFHHHAALCITAYAFFIAERSRLSPPHPRRKPPFGVPSLPGTFEPRGASTASL
jgi:SRSO17 transposase